MIITKMGLSQIWLNVSILLSLVVIMIDGWIEPRMKKIIKIISESQEQGNDIPAEFGLLIKRSYPSRRRQPLMIAILVLMVVKPF